MAKAGFAVDATDGVAAMVRKARERTGLPVREMRFDALDADAEYDAVWAHACLLHVPSEKLPVILTAIHRALRPGGWHFANYKLGPAGEEGDGRDLLGRLHNFPRAGWLRDTYTEAGFGVVDSETYVGNASDGTQRDWLALTVRKP